MQKRFKKCGGITGVLFLIFVVFTVLVKMVDVQAIGPEQSAVGFASVNGVVAELFGVNMVWYQITEWLGAVAVAAAMGFAVLGLVQMVRRRSVWKVDGRILLLGAFYFLVVVFYAFFEVVVINYRPVILAEGLEASFPSSHTMVSICIMVTAMMQFHHYLRGKRAMLRAADIVFGLILAATVIGRLVSGVHWFTDIVGGVLLASALIALYCTALLYMREKGWGK